MKYYAVGFLFMVLSAVLMDSKDLIWPVIAMALGLILIVVGNWYEQKLVNKVNDIEVHASEYFKRQEQDENKSN